MNAANARITRSNIAYAAKLRRLGWSLREIAGIFGMPSASTICGWLRKR